MRRRHPIAFALLLAVCACGPAAGHRASVTPAPVISPEPVVGPPLDGLPAVPAVCEQPAPKADDFRAVEVRSPLRVLAKDRALGSLDRLAVGGDGAIWATYTGQAWKQGALESSDGGVRLWDGAKWRAFAVPVLPGRSWSQVTALAAASADRAWVVGVSHGAGTVGFVGSFEGGAWRVRPLEGAAGQVIGWGGTAAARTEAGLWAVGGRVALLWNGSAWESYALPAKAGAVSGDWAVSGPLQPAPAVMHWEGTGWQELGVPALTLPPGAEASRVHLDDVAELGPSDVWVVGGVSWMEPGSSEQERYRPVALHWDGARWDCSWGALGTATFAQVEPDGRGGVWVLDSTGARLLHRASGRWTSARLNATVNTIAARPGTGEVYAAGSVGAAQGPTRAVLWRVG